MCGIAAYFGEDVRGLTGRYAALAALARRGPDNEGEWMSPDGIAWLGHRRLSIVDLSPAGNQPMLSTDGTLALVCNGEIYNYPDLRRQLEARGHRFQSHCDSESILYAYREWGEECLERLEGMFAFVLWDLRNRRALAARDRIGIKPLYFAETAGGLALASDARAARSLLPEPPGVDPLAVAYVLTLGYVPSPHAIWRGIRKLEAGHFLSWRPGMPLRVTRYWSPPTTLHAGPASAGRAWPELFESVLREHLLSDVPMGLFLSGGIDSNCVAAGLHDLGERVACVTVGFPDNAAGDESPAAATTAAHLGMPHRSVPLRLNSMDQLLRDTVSSLDEPQGYSAPLTMFAVSREAAGTNKVILAGDGGDECFAGYSWYAGLDRPLANERRWWWPSRRPIVRPGASADDRKAAMSRFAEASVLHRHAARLFPRFLPEEASALLAPTGMRFDDETMLEPLRRHFIATLPLKRALQRIDLMTFCSDSILAKVDRTSMAHGLEVRVPFLDRRIVEWSLPRPPDAREETESKPILRDYLASRVPAAILQRPKQGFSIRIDGLDWDAEAAAIGESGWIKDGLWSGEWRSAIAPGTPYREGRIWTLAMLSAWYDSVAGREGQGVSAPATRAASA